MCHVTHTEGGPKIFLLRLEHVENSSRLYRNNPRFQQVDQGLSDVNEYLRGTGIARR